MATRKNNVSATEAATGFVATWVTIFVEGSFLFLTNCLEEYLYSKHVLPRLQSTAKKNEF